ADPVVTVVRRHRLLHYALTMVRLRPRSCVPYDAPGPGDRTRRVRIRRHGRLLRRDRPRPTGRAGAGGRALRRLGPPGPVDAGGGDLLRGGAPEHPPPDAARDPARLAPAPPRPGARGR